jgi:exopolysaccharide biosynthesis polyprenyl glycosylphosphotransferase
MQGLRDIHFLLQLCIVGVCFWVYLIFFLGVYRSDGLSFEKYLIYCTVLLFGIFIHRVFTNNVRLNMINRSISSCHDLAFKQTLFGAGTLAFYVLASKDLTISRVFLFSFFPLLYFVFLSSHRWLPSALAQRIFKTSGEQRTLLVGSPVRAAELKKWLNRKKIFGVRTLGLLIDERDGFPENSAVPILGGSTDFEMIIQDYNITHAIFLDFPFHPRLTARLIHICDKLEVRPIVMDNLRETFLHNTHYFEEDGVRFISLRTEPLENPWNRFLKRMLDILISLPVVLLLLPCTNLVVWIYQKLQSPGKLFHCQLRAGMQNRQFPILKYRTMHENHNKVGKQATRDDARIFPAGRWFRRYSVDEVAQFWNVLKGDMSVVGPRPHLIEHNEQFARIMDSYHVRSYIKPGITGLAQIKGCRGETKTEEDIIRRVEWDIHYLENWSLGLDINIILKTFVQVVRPPSSAY